jgi:signal transduction histidine kinase
MDKVSVRETTEIEDPNQLKDDFLSTISHELRSPITNIKVATRMLKLLLQEDEKNENENTQFLTEPAQTKFKAKVNHYLLILEQECDREMNLLNNFLDLQQLDAGNYCLDQTRVNLQEAIPIVVKPFLNRVANQQQTLQLEIAANLPILGIDQTSLERILVELLGNACKFTPIGEVIVVKLSLESTSLEALKTLQVRVTNSGVEIPLSDCSQIFERFYRIANGDRWKHDGTGLGLTLVKKLTEHLGGTIQVESGAGKTCFTVEIPIHS